ncbi:MAG: Rrf2 family transcriptional regulator [Lachnospiraceae bacterium]|nr:Rrf2 family transcriptional regulator [Lachnospiraceae bacterium]
MTVSTKGRYALRVMIDLSEHIDEGYVKLEDISKRQEVSEKFLESILSVLCRAGIVDSSENSDGYKLNKSPEEYNVAEILLITEGQLSPVPCVEKPVNDCPRYDKCKTVKMWEGLYKTIKDYLGNYTIGDLANNDVKGYLGDE